MLSLLATADGLLSALFWITMGALGSVGLLAALSPRRFAALSSRGNRWIDTEKLLQPLDKRVDVDGYVLPFSRCLGVAVLGAVMLLCALYTKF